MIRTVGDLLVAVRDTEIKRLASFPELRHGPVIGDMYEGLTRELVERAIFDGLNLSVREGFISCPDGSLSKQIDCMVVIGEGQRLPHTDHWIYPAAQVVAVVEVKKSLYGADLKDAHANLLSATFEPTTARAPSGFVDQNFRSIARHGVPERVEDLPFHLEMLYHALAIEASQPLRIALGHFGYTSENGLRRGFVKFLSANVSEAGAKKTGFGPTSLPDLVLCRDFGLAKANGLPFVAPLDDGWWHLLLSFSGNPFHYLVECLWTRLSMIMPLPSSIWGEDLERESLSFLLDARAIETDSGPGWHYTTVEIDDALLAERPGTTAWTPTEITFPQAVFLTVLGKLDVVYPDDDEFLRFAAQHGVDPDEFIEQMVATGLVYQGEDRGLRYLTEACASVILPDGRFVAADSADGRLAAWVARESERLSKKVPGQPEP